ncbi:hypothetical protein E3N88_01116 [Mikania micrantha]|uniref:Protein FAR1-RELATED SEQUENCE n=1 Tax=Mikania micrantha TaxID=192012 RepID=A0A5N6Q2T6_9ASTR|nr:hypothetical protein E3N88_01116 [Mikania micrantha]
MGGGDHNVSDVLEDHGSVQVDDVVVGQDFGHGGVHDRDDDDLDDNEDLWVPAYFHDTPMSCLMKTTSRCESSNALFKVNSTAANTLVQFMMCFDTTIDNQRYNQRILEFQTSNSRPDLRCGLDIEAHESEIYTHSVFKDVQKEIFKGMMNCFISNVDVIVQSKVFTISHMDHNMDFVNEFKGERAIEKSKKNPRLCRSCNQLTFHDSRNCKLRSDNGSSG